MVSKGQRKSDNLDVAIKRLKNCYDGFIEKNTLDYLRHKNIVHLEAFFVLEDRMFLVMECGKCDMKFASLCKISSVFKYFNEFNYFNLLMTNISINR